MRRCSCQWLITLSLLGLAACSSNPPVHDSAPREGFDANAVPDADVLEEPRSQYGNPTHYEVFGKRYYVLGSSNNFAQSGIASWYGTKFHGKRTSSGEPYDMYAMTAAHKTLPLPTYVRVTNLENQRQIVVKVNDRGPFVGDRIIDLSYTAAIKLDMTAKGTARVRIEALLPGDPDLHGAKPTQTIKTEQLPSMVASGEARVFVQVGAFSDSKNALRMEQRLHKQGFVTVVRNSREAGRNIYRVRIGPLPDEAAFDNTMIRLRELDYTDAHMALE
ncbi:MAG: septal ring lytic transglycosylase RlpA family protein [Gammaproteobacteria bacterium]|nr:septal ring lytic transglycosylase RlpA family protein [Gammaproteobacteria bacterium]